MVKKLISVSVLILIACSLYAAVTIEEPQTVTLQPGQTFSIPGTSYADIAREEQKEKIAPFVIGGFLILFIFL